MSGISYVMMVSPEDFKSYALGRSLMNIIIFQNQTLSYVKYATLRVNSNWISFVWNLFLFLLFIAFAFAFESRSTVWANCQLY